MTVAASRQEPPSRGNEVQYVYSWVLSQVALSPTAECRLQTVCCRQLGAWKVAGSVSLHPKPRHRSADMGRWAGDADMQAVAALQGWGAGEGGLG